MKAPGTHCSGPRPKSQNGSPVTTSSPILFGEPQLKCPVPAVELPDGEQWTASCCPSIVGVFALSKTTTRSPFGSTTGSEPWLKLQLLASSVLSKRFPNWQSAGLAPLISSG